MHVSQDYIIPSDNWEQQLYPLPIQIRRIISYQAITGNNNYMAKHKGCGGIISYQAITGNNNSTAITNGSKFIISYQAITGNNNMEH